MRSKIESSSAVEAQSLLGSRGNVLCSEALHQLAVFPLPIKLEGCSLLGTNDLYKNLYEFHQKKIRSSVPHKMLKHNFCVLVGTGKLQFENHLKVTIEHPMCTAYA